MPRLRPGRRGRPLPRRLGPLRQRAQQGERLVEPARALIRLRGPRRGAQPERRAMRTYELLSSIAVIASVGIALGAVVAGRSADLHAALHKGMQASR